MNGSQQVWVLRLSGFIAPILHRFCTAVATVAIHGAAVAQMGLGNPVLLEQPPSRTTSIEVPGFHSLYFLVASRSADGKPRPSDTVRGVAFAYDRDASTCTLLTVAHVVKGAIDINVYLWTAEMAAGGAFEARLAWVDEKSDIAALTIRNTDDCRPVVLYDAPVPIGRRVNAFLHTPHARGMVTAGYIGGYWILNGIPTIVCDMQIQPGHSGSPLFDDFGRFIGMMVSKAKTLEINAGFAVPADQIEVEFIGRKAATRTATPNDER